MQIINAQRYSVLVSIHAPAWGATEGVVFDGHYQTVSIHAPAWGATHTFTDKSREGLSFNPRARVGRDIFVAAHYHGGFVSIHAPAWGATRQYCLINIFLPVSIHAPAWGATHFFYCLARNLSVSIHAPAWGATSGQLPQLADFFLFQSTRPRGARQRIP